MSDEFWNKFNEAEAAVAEEEVVGVDKETGEQLTFQGLADIASAAFEEFCAQRHAMGEEKYGPVKFLAANTIEEAMYEVIDLANYARYTFIKLYLLNVYLHNKATEEGIPEDFIGAQTFIPNSNKFGTTQ